MNIAAFNLLSPSERRDVSLNACHWDRLAGTRAEIVVSLPEGSQPIPAVDQVQFAAGQQVRIVRPPHPTEIGTIQGLPEDLVSLGSGIQTLVAEVRLENEVMVAIPLTNLEVLE